MGPYHAAMVHFPVALWISALLIIAIRVFSDAPLARTLARTLVPLLLFGGLTGIVAFVLGLLVWPLETWTGSPLARNHMLLASWSLGYWGVLLLIAWRAGSTVWAPVARWFMLGLGLLGVGLLIITGTLGGHLAGRPSAISHLLALGGWEVFTTFYVPVATIALILLAASLFVVAGWLFRR